MTSDNLTTVPRWRMLSFLSAVVVSFWNTTRRERWFENTLTLSLPKVSDRWLTSHTYDTGKSGDAA